MPETTSPRVRKTFSKLEKVLDVPNLIDIQKASFRWFMGDPSDPNSLKTSGLRETIDDISPIRDYSERLEVAWVNTRSATRSCPSASAARRTSPTRCP